jgi:tetratricopeptide (TPR) repeat protein
VTVLFADIAGSTVLAATLDPEVWRRVLNRAFACLTEPIQEYGGTVARLMGDGILAFFGAPTAHENDPARAVHAGLAIVERVAALRKELERERRLNLAVRVGINTGLGDAGLGKSRLMAELQRRAVAGDPLPVTWLEGRALSYGPHLPYWPFRTILQTCCGIAEEDDEAVAWGKLAWAVEMRCGPEAESVLPFLASILALETPAGFSDPRPYLNADAVGQQIVTATRTFFSHMAQERPLALVFEDLHWADHASSRLLERLFPLVHDHPLMVCGVGRPRLDGPVAALRDAATQVAGPRYAEVRLTALSDPEARALIGNLLPLKSPAPALVDTVLRKADGNPLYMEELVRSLIATGVLTRETSTGRWRVKHPLADVAVPETIQSAIVARVDRLDEPSRRLLRLAAVIGRAFPRRLLRAAADPDLPVETLLTGLEEVELIHMRHTTPEVEYAFKHALLRDAVYEGILLERRKRLHARVATCLEAQYAGRLEAIFGLLAYHYAQAERWDRAQHYLFLAGDQAGRQAASSEALTHYGRALALYNQALGDRRDTLGRAQLTRKIAEAYYGQRGRLGESEEQLREALALLNRRMPESKIGLALGLLSQFVVQAAHRLWPSRFLGFIPAARQERVLEAVRAYELLAQIYFFRNKAGNLYAALRSLNLAEAVGPSPELARAYGLNCVYPAMVSLSRLSETYRRLALATAREQENPATTAYVLESVGVYHTGAGQWTAAVEMLEQAIQLNDGIGRRRWSEETRTILAIALHHQGEWTRSQALAQSALLSAREREDPETQVWSLACLALNRVWLDQADGVARAVAALEDASTLLEQYQHPVVADQILVYGLLAQARWQQGLALAALESARHALACIDSERVANTFYSLAGYGGLALALVEMTGSAAATDAGRDASELRAAGRHACRALGRFARIFPIARPRAAFVQGQLAWRQGKQRRTRRAWLRSLTWAERLAMPLDRALAHEALGLCAAGNGQAANAHCRKALTLYRRLGSASAADRLRARLAQIS